MHGSIRLVTTSRATRGTSQALEARRWEVVWRGHVPDFRGEVTGQIENNFSLFFVKNIISRAVDQMAADSVAVWLVAENTDS